MGLYFMPSFGFSLFIFTVFLLSILGSNIDHELSISLKKKLNVTDKDDITDDGSFSNVTEMDQSSPSHESSMTTAMQLVPSSPKTSNELVQVKEKAKAKAKLKHKYNYSIRFHKIVEILKSGMLPMVLAMIVANYDPYDPLIEELYDKVMKGLIVPDEIKETIYFYNQDFASQITLWINGLNPPLPSYHYVWPQVASILHKWAEFMKQSLADDDEKFENIIKIIPSAISVIERQSLLKFPNLKKSLDEKSGKFDFSIFHQGESRL